MQLQNSSRLPLDFKIVLLDFALQIFCPRIPSTEKRFKGFLNSPRTLTRASHARPPPRECTKVEKTIRLRDAVKSQDIPDCAQLAEAERELVQFYYEPDGQSGLSHHVEVLKNQIEKLQQSLEKRQAGINEIIRQLEDKFDTAVGTRKPLAELYEIMLQRESEIPVDDDDSLEAPFGGRERQHFPR